MRAEKDFEELLGLFNKHKVKYCVVGAFAFGFHAKPRYTKDMDIFVEPSSENGKRIVSALKDFGFEGLDITPKDFAKTGRFIQLGYEPVRVDIITSIQGCRFSSAWKNKVIGYYGKQKVFFLGLNNLIANKRLSNRRQDKVDLEILLKVKDET